MGHSNPQMKSGGWFLVVAIALLAACTMATWGAEQKAAAQGLRVADCGLRNGSETCPEPSRRIRNPKSEIRNVGSVVVQAGSTLEPAEHGDPTSTPQPGSWWHSESGHSPGAMLDSTPLSLTGSYYQWGWATTCHGVDKSSYPWTCIGETNTFYCDDSEMHNLATIYNVTSGGWAYIGIYQPDGTLYSQCQLEIADPHDYGWDYWSSYSLYCWATIAGSPMVQYPGWWHTEVYLWDYGQWINEAVLWWELICESPPTPTPTITRTPTRTATPTPTRTPTTGSGIYGRVTANLSPAAGVTLDLRLWDGSSWSTLLTTTTASNGAYSFIGAPSLASGQSYHVRYLNAYSASGLLWGWWGPNITSYTAGANVPGGDFDLADVGLGNPHTETPQALPVTFYWTMRNIASDRYEFEILNAETYEILWRSGDLGRVSSFTLTSLPPGITTGIVYGWDVRINSSQGVGLSYGTNLVAFATGPVPPTATPTRTPTPRPGMTRHVYLPLVLKNYHVLCDGDFEQPTLGPCWTWGGELPASLVTQLYNGEPARGQRTLLLGNPALGPVFGDSTALPPGSAWVEQRVSVPVTGAPRLTFQHRLFTYDRSCLGGGEGRTCQKPSDNLVVSINDKPVSRLGYEGAWSGPPPLQDLGWQPGTIDLTPWRGQVVTVRFAVWNDEFNYGKQSTGSYNTWGYVDEVVVSP